MTVEEVLNRQPETDPGVDLGSRGLERHFDPIFVARLALREKQVQQSYRPIISIHKWFARRPGSVFRSLLLAEFGSGELTGDYWRSHEFEGVVADPFMGGGTTVYESVRLGLSVVGCDLNPMSYLTVRQAVTPLDLERFTQEAESVIADVRTEVGDLYVTRCLECSSAAEVKYFHLVKTCDCPACGQEVTLFPGLRIAEACRHPREVYHCPRCDALREVSPGEALRCPECAYDLAARPTSRGSTTCSHCGERFRFASQLAHPPRHRMFGIEYHCKHCYAGIEGRQFKTPDSEDFARVERATGQLSELREGLSIPDEAIPSGDETSRLHRWGYQHWYELFSDRQLLGLGLLMKRISRVADDEMRFALATVFSDFLRYQNLLCRYDTYALKCQDIFAVHGFPVALLACENNILGIPKVGSGSFVHFVAKYLKAKQYAQRPYETAYVGGKKVIQPIEGESIETSLADREPEPGGRAVWLACAPSQKLLLRPESLDGVFTDPPYYDNVQYAELMDFCYVWLRKFMGSRAEFSATTTRTDDELTGNVTRVRGLQEFTTGLSEVFCQMSIALKPGAPLVFTYHHNDAQAYVPLIVAILDAGLVCTRVLVAPGEMSASLHIAGTKSSILDSVFVCRKRDYADPIIDQRNVRECIAADAEAMHSVPYKPTLGDLACLEAGHLAAAAIRRLASDWVPNAPLERRFTLAVAAVTAARQEVQSVL